MAEKKKPTTTKKTTTKAKASAVKRKKATTPKKAVVKKTVANKTTKKPVVRKTAPKVKNSPKFFNWSQWKDLFGQAVDCWKAIIGKFSLVLFISLGLQLVNFFLYSTSLSLVLGGQQGLENIVANLQVGTLPEAKIVALFLLITLGWMCICVLIALMSKVAFVGLIRNYVKGSQSSVKDLFFNEGFKRSGGYFWLGLKVALMIAWPFIIIAAVAFSTVSIDLTSFESAEPEVFFPPYVGLGLFLAMPLAFLYLVYMSVRLLFAMQLFVHTKSTAKMAFSKAWQLTKNSWWYVFCMWGLVVALLYGVNQLLFQASLIDPVVLIDAIDPEEQLGLVDLLAFLLSLFIFAPIAASFQYMLMLKVAKNQSVKL